MSLVYRHRLTWGKSIRAAWRNNDSGVTATGAMRNECHDLGVISASRVTTTRALSGSLPEWKCFVLWTWRTWHLRQHVSRPIRRCTRRMTLIQMFSTIMTWRKYECGLPETCLLKRNTEVPTVFQCRLCPVFAECMPPWYLNECCDLRASTLNPGDMVHMHSAEYEEKERCFCLIVEMETPNAVAVLWVAQEEKRRLLLKSDFSWSEALVSYRIS
jgi:hypothetical protein